MSEQHKGDYILLNATERFIKNLAPDMITKLEGCKCEVCTMDVLALSLNSFNGNYVTLKSSDDVEMAVRLRITPDDKKKIVLAITKSIEFVKENPRH
jgi:competence protein ComFB